MPRLSIVQYNFILIFFNNIVPANICILFDPNKYRINMQLSNDKYSV